MIHPNNFAVNEAWIAFRISSSPVRTEEDGDFNCFALMDAASCYIFGCEFVPVAAPELTRTQIRRLLDDAKSRKDQLPKTLFVPREEVADVLTREATHYGIEVVRISEQDLLVFINDAREGFAERFEGVPRDA